MGTKWSKKKRVEKKGIDRSADNDDDSTTAFGSSLLVTAAMLLLLILLLLLISVYFWGASYLGFWTRWKTSLFHERVLYAELQSCSLYQIPKLLIFVKRKLKYSQTCNFCTKKLFLLQHSKKHIASKWDMKICQTKTWPFPRPFPCIYRNAEDGKVSQFCTQWKGMWTESKLYPWGRTLCVYLSSNSHIYLASIRLKKGIRTRRQLEIDA